MSQQDTRAFMRIPRIFQHQQIQVESAVLLDAEASHYVKNVLRMMPGQNIKLFNGQIEGDFHAVITMFHGKKVEVMPTIFEARLVESPLKITLAQAISRGDKMDFTLQKAVELGVHAIVPLMTERVGVKLDQTRKEHRLIHWEKIVMSACEQSGRSFIPSVQAPQVFSSWVKTVKSDMKILLDPHQENKKILNSFSPKEVLLLIGPEGGLSEQECQMAYEAGFIGWQLGPRVLRTETAGLTAMSLLQFLWGDFK